MPSRNYAAGRSSQWCGQFWPTLSTRGGNERMQAIVRTRYGAPAVLQLTEVAIPVPRDNEILIKLHAVSVNRSDWETLRGTPLYARIGGLRKPRHQILGSDI